MFDTELLYLYTLMIFQDGGKVCENMWRFLQKECFDGCRESITVCLAIWDQDLKKNNLEIVGF